MRDFQFQEGSPAYRQIFERLLRDIRSGALPHGTRLLPVRELAAKLNVSVGTAGHAYSELERLSLIEKTPGRGTFVRSAPEEEPGSRKTRALSLIGSLLDEMELLGFSPEESRIFFDLTLREREGLLPPVRVGAIDCSPEALSVIRAQLLSLAPVDVREFSLESVLKLPGSFDPGLDVCVTTSTHFNDVREKMKDKSTLTAVAMTFTSETVLALARIPENASARILTKSERFASVLKNAAETFRASGVPFGVSLFGESAPFSEADVLILPENYPLFCSSEEAHLISALSREGRAIVCRYQIDKGSLLHLKERIEAIIRSVSVSTPRK